MTSAEAVVMALVSVQWGAKTVERLRCHILLVVAQEPVPVRMMLSCHLMVAVMASSSGCCSSPGHRVGKRRWGSWGQELERDGQCCPLVVEMGNGAWWYAWR
jgi:hypothetical protein